MSLDGALKEEKMQQGGGEPRRFGYLNFSAPPHLPVAFHILVSVLLAACASGNRDVVPESHDVRVTDPAAVQAAKTKGAAEGYVYIARRPHGAIALAEARGIGDAIASRAIDRLADSFEGCAADLDKRRQLVDGAMRVVAGVDPGGTLVGLNVKMGSGNAITANALLCVIAPLKLLTFPPAEGDAGARGIAIETTWSPRAP